MLHYVLEGSWLQALEFHSKSGWVVLKSGHDCIYGSPLVTHTEHLDDGERIIGYCSEVSPDLDNDGEGHYFMLAAHFGLSLIIGRLI